MALRLSEHFEAETQRLSEPIRAEARYLEVQALPKYLVHALVNKERVYVSGKPHRVKSLGISEGGQIMGKLEPVELVQPS